jgi:hypothetical protein
MWQGQDNLPQPVFLLSDRATGLWIFRPKFFENFQNFGKHIRTDETACSENTTEISGTDVRRASDCGWSEKMDRTGKSGLWARYLESLKTSVSKRGSAASGSRQRRRRPDSYSGSEALESRTLLSGTGLAVQTGDDGPNILIATQGPSNSDTLTGLGGDDTLISDGGLDELNGGDGDDRLVVVAVPFRNAHGGSGNDVLEFRKAGNFDLTKLSTGDVQGVEAIDLADPGELSRSTLKINAETVTDCRWLRCPSRPEQQTRCNKRFSE